jgi:hypothetical protein
VKNKEYCFFEGSISLEDLTCSSIICSHGAKCRINDSGLSQCHCPNNCDEYIRTIASNGPVCGSDHHTYETICELNRKACELQKNISLVHLGKCRMFIFFSRKNN